MMKLFIMEQAVVIIVYWYKDTNNV